MHSYVTASKGCVKGKCKAKNKEHAKDLRVISVLNVFKIETMFYELWSVIEMHGMPLLVVLWSRHCQKCVKVERLICIRPLVINRQKNTILISLWKKLIGDSPSLSFAFSKPNFTLRTKIKKSPLCSVCWSQWPKITYFQISSQEKSSIPTPLSPFFAPTPLLFSLKGLFSYHQTKLYF